MTKAELRKAYKRKRQKLLPEQVDNLSLAIANELLSLDIWQHSFYHIFLSIEEQQEVNTDFILNILLGKDKNIVVSKSDFSTGTLTHYLLTDNTLIKKNKYQIPEPVDGIQINSEKIDVVFVPLLAFDTQGNRVGYGKGFYDRFLSGAQSETIKIGLSFFEAEKPFKEVSKTDVKLDLCVTPKRVYRF